MYFLMFKLNKHCVGLYVRQFKLNKAFNVKCKLLNVQYPLLSKHAADVCTLNE